MTLLQFPYKTTKTIADYSDIVTKALQDFGNITPGKSENIPCGVGEDILAYWDECSENICFGRFCIYNEKIHFWIGLDITPCKIQFIIWFKKAAVESFISTLKENFDVHCNDPFGTEIWIVMNCHDFKGLCNIDSGSNIPSDIIKNFLDSVFTVLNGITK